MTVSDVLPGGPAHADGRLKRADRITAIAEGDNGFIDVVGWRLDDVVEMLRGPGGTQVRLRVLPAGAPPGSLETNVELTRSKVMVDEQAAKGDVFDASFEGRTYKIGVITLPSFYQDLATRDRGEHRSASGDIARLLGEFEAEGVDGIVMDLRGNGGGDLSEAAALSGLFIAGGPVVQLQEIARELEVLDDPSASAHYDGPLAVLVDRLSASAAEIFAAAIQDYERGVIIGQQTFGKGSVQTVFNLDRTLRGEGNGELTLTIAKYYRVTGESTQLRGVSPDIELPSAIDVAAVGESTGATALAWDRIDATPFSTGSSLDRAIATLQNHWAVYSQDSEMVAPEHRGRVAVSLNLAQRQHEREQDRLRLERENARRAHFHLPPLMSVEALDSASNVDRGSLERATRIVAEMASLEDLLFTVP